MNRHAHEVRPAQFTLADDDERLDGYTDGSTWNGWAMPYFTREQLEAAVGPYDVRFLEPGQLGNDHDYPIAIVYFDDPQDPIHSTPIVVDGEIIEAYCLDGFEFMEVTDDEQD